MKMRLISYSHEETSLEGYLATPDETQRPVVILCHAWQGRDDFICEKARLMAEWGYVGFALDMYGKGVLGKTAQENAALKRPFIEDRSLLQARLLSAYEVVRALPEADLSRVAVIGFGFGGLCALDLVRSGVPLQGAVSFYGHFDPSPVASRPGQASVLVLHGTDDPVVKRGDLDAFIEEMKEAGVDLQIHLYGSTQHAFMNPAVNLPAAGLVYNERSAQRAWGQCREFLKDPLSR